MGEMLEIRWHGRGGQGAKLAANLMGEAVVAVGKYAQAFPEYGPERMGAPVTSYNRISDEPITVHSGVTNPRYVAVLDRTFIGTIDVLAGIPQGGALVVNTGEEPAKVREKLGDAADGIEIYTVDASKISLETIGIEKPNTPMLGALARVSGIVSLEDLLEDTRSKLEKKFRGRPEIIEGNLKAIERAYQEVKSE